MAKIIIKSSIHKNIYHFGTPFKALNNYTMIIHPNHSFVKGYTQKSQFVNKDQNGASISVTLLLVWYSLTPALTSFGIEINVIHCPTSQVTP